jgi:hypothetical protein
MINRGLTWSEIQRSAKMFAEDHKDASRERGETQSFYNEFFEIFGIKRRSVAKFEEHVKLLDNTSGFIDLFWRGVLLVEQKSAGRSLDVAAKEADEYFDAIPEHEKPQYQLVCDFQRFELLDRDTGKIVRFKLEELPDNIHHFAFILGDRVPSFRTQEPVNREAAMLVARLHSSLLSSGYPEGKMDRLLVRLVFCLFADCTGIFRPRGHFTDYIEANSSTHGGDLGPLLAQLFQILDQQQSSRQRNLPDDLEAFPYINGDLFAEILPIASFDKATRSLLIEAGHFDWSKVSPAVFGSLFQSVLSKEDISSLSRHPTSELNILKVLDDLFVRDLKEELESIPKESPKKRAALLRAFLEKLAKLTFLDPACGCGNFLAVAYRELRRIETDALFALSQIAKLNLNSPDLSRVDVDQFFGIEISEYSVRIAETSLWMTDHIMNTALGLKLNTVYARVPLTQKPAIFVGDALTNDWNTVIPSMRCSFILGNPPYRGSKKQTAGDRLQLDRILKGSGGDGGTLDYSAAWLIKSAQYASKGTRIAFVLVNSLTEGQQVAQLWPLLFEKHGFEIFFAHQPFVWQSGALQNSAVHVVIVGIVDKNQAGSRRRLFRYPDPTAAPTVEVVGAISPYLIAADQINDPHCVVREAVTPINGLRELKTGTKPIDGGHYIFDSEEKRRFLAAEPRAQRFVRPYIGTEEYLNNTQRYLLYLPDAMAPMFCKLRSVMNLVKKVKQYREGLIGNKKAGKNLKKVPHDLAPTPRKFHITNVPTAPFLLVPEVTSEKRSYIPMGFMRPPVIPSNLVKILPHATLLEFGLLTSMMHMAWMRIIGGSLENRYRYSIGIVYNTFPLPEALSPTQAAKIEKLAQGVLDARSVHQNLTPKQLYDSETMPDDLRQAHKKLDAAVERAYAAGAFASDDERVAHLLNLYDSRRNSLLVPMSSQGARPRRRKQGDQR